MPVATLAILDRDPPRDDRAVALETLTHLAQRGGREAELGLHVLDGAWTGGREVPQ